MKYNTDTIKTVVSCRELCENNGIAVGSNGKARCVFHDDAHASMHIYADGIHCFSCGAHGDVIDLARQIYGCDFNTACKILAETYGIAPISDNNEYRRMAEEQRRKRLERQQQIEHLRDDYFYSVAEFRDAEANKERYAPRSPTAMPDKEFFVALDQYNSASDRMRRAEWALNDAERKGE